MKLNWFSPLPPAPTDVGHFTMRVLPALAARADVTLWTDQPKWDAALKKFAEVRSYNLKRIPWADLNRAGVCIYNIGNNPLFHGAIWQIARQHSGVVILHDTRLHHLFDGLYRVQWRDLSAYLALMEFHYGPAGRNDGYECFMSEAQNINEMAEKYPLTELATENALGMIVHTQHAFDALKRKGAAPLIGLPLPFAAPRHAAQPKEQTGREEKQYRLILFGYIGRNRRLDAVLKALADFPQREKFRLDIYGTILDDEKQVRAQIRALGLKSLVTLHGFTPEAELDEALAASDLAINLRYPTMGEASGSQLRIWAHGLPALVTNIGWYATLPAAAVGFVRADENEVADIQSHLLAFLDDPAKFARMGQNGLEILEQEHSPENYAAGLLEFVAEAAQFRARSAACKLAERVGEVTMELLGTAPESMLTSVATEIGVLTGTGR
jgi:glycosyltransferase involved in cell wall biosynthesis